MNARQAMDAANSAEVEVALIQIDHPDLDAPVRLSTDPTDRLSVDPLRYGTRSSWLGATDPFLFVLASAEVPGDQEDAPAAANIVLENVTNDIAATLRQVSTRATVHLAVVLASSPDQVEVEFRDMSLVGADGDAGEIRLSLTRAPIEAETVPMDRFSRDRFLGLFR